MMTTIDARSLAPQSVRPDTVPARIVAVVGFDGSEASHHALATARRLLAGRSSRLQVVYVAHVGAAAGMAPDGGTAVADSLNDIAHDLSREADRLMDHQETWEFERRDGAVAPELLAAALAHEAPDTEVILVVGASAHRYHEVIGSVPAALVRHAKLAVLVVP